MPPPPFSAPSVTKTTETEEHLKGGELDSRTTRHCRQINKQRSPSTTPPPRQRLTTVQHQDVLQQPITNDTTINTLKKEQMFGLWENSRVVRKGNVLR